MRALLYRLSWDKDYRKRSLIVGACSIGAVALVFMIAIFVTKYITFNYDDKLENESEEDNSGPYYGLVFDNNVTEEDINDSSSESKDPQSQRNNTEGNNNYNQESSSNDGCTTDTHTEQQKGVHVHQWKRIIDGPAWTEYKKVQVGTQYRCNNCGFTTSSASSISSHCSRLSHSFSQIPIYDTKSVYHEEISHLECNCGAKL